MTRWYGLATDGSSDKDDKFLPVLVRHVDKDSGLTAIALLDMPNIDSESTEHRNVVFENRSKRSVFIRLR